MHIFNQSLLLSVFKEMQLVVSWHFKLENLKCFNVIFMGLLKHQLYKMIFPMRKTDFTLALKTLIYWLVIATQEFLFQKTYNSLLEKTFWLKYVIISTTCASVASFNHLLFP